MRPSGAINTSCGYFGTSIVRVTRRDAMSITATCRARGKGDHQQAAGRRGRTVAEGGERDPSIQSIRRRIDDREPRLRLVGREGQRVIGGERDALRFRRDGNHRDRRATPRSTTDTEPGFTFDTYARLPSRGSANMCDSAAPVGTCATIASVAGSMIVIAFSNSLETYSNPSRGPIMRSADARRVQNQNAL